MSKVVGIDLGTTNSLVAYVKNGVPLIIRDSDGDGLVPSVVSVADDGRVCVGREAERRLLTDARRTAYSVKRFMGKGREDVVAEASHFPFRIAGAAGDVVRIGLGDREFTPPEISAFVLRELKRRAEAWFAGQGEGDNEVDRAVITVPAYFNDAQRTATRDAGRIAGLEVMRIVNEPTAASLAYGLDKRHAGVIAVYDLGGGTFDISILRVEDGVFQVLSTNGDTHLGGDDIDVLLMDWVIARGGHTGPPLQTVSGADRLQNVVGADRLQNVVGAADPLQNVVGADPLQDVVGADRLQNVVGAADPLQNVVGADRLQNVVGADRLQNVVGADRLQNVVGADRLQNVVGADRLQNVVGADRLQNVVGAADPLQNVVGADPLQDVVGADRLQNVVGADRLQNVVGADPRVGPPEVLQEIRKAVIQAKWDLSDRDETELLGRRITRAEFDTLIQPIVNRTLAPCRQALADAGLQPSQIDEVVLVGGSTRIPLVRKAVADLFGRTPHSELNPDEVVALGAAVQADILVTGNRDMLLLDVTPLSLGIETMGGVVSKIILRNSTIPATGGETFTTAVDNQTAVDIHVLQGERELVADNRSLARFKLRGIPPMPAGLPRVQVQFQIDANGILSVTAREQRTEVEQTVDVKPSYGLTDEDVERMLLDSFEHAEADIAARLLIEARNEAESVITATEKSLRSPAMADIERDELKPGEREKIEGVLSALKMVTSSSDRDTIQKWTQALNDTTKHLAEVMMNRSIRTALTGKNVGDL